MGLTEYRRKRHFNKTSEPGPKKPAKKGWSYVIQKHDATRLHYDFRLEMDGVLKSWAVPKGPSLDPSVKRLAVQVEDHPVAYGSFEGVIPQGEYGGGTVLLWDRGTWESVGDPEADYREGKLKFVLNGEKLHGGWTLIRTHRTGSSKDSPQWLLIKERDEEAQPASEGDILEQQPLSVASERDLDSIASSRDRVWSSKPSAKSAAKRSAVKKTEATQAAKNGHRSKLKAAAGGSLGASAPRTRGTRPTFPTSSSSKGATTEPMPREIDVQLATLTDQPPQGDQWLHEIKFDGYRMICHIDHSQVRFITRNHNDWTKRLAHLASAAEKLPCQQAILDGEVVLVQSDGTTDFQSLQNAFRDDRADLLKYYVFDLLYCDGQNLSNLPLEERKSALQKLLDNAATKNLFLFSEHITGHGDEFMQHACRSHLEGMISKRRDRPYQPGRGVDWLKVKCIHDEEFVIGGFTDPSGSRAGFGALLVGFFDEHQKLHYAGKVGTGFDARQLKSMHSRLKSLEQDESPFVDLQRKIGPARTAHWVQPSLVGQFKYGSRTDENRLRHASFQGLREDKPADEVTMETPVSVKQAQQSVRLAKAKSPKSADSRSAAGSDHKSVSKKPDMPKKVKGTVARSKERADDYDAESETFAGVRLTHPQKVLYPETGVTKLDVAKYYQAIADWILPHLAHRPIVLVRCPEGPAKECFYQKHPGVGTPATLRQIPIVESRKTGNYAIVDDVEDLLALVQLGALEIHTWGSREDNLEKPDRLIFDLDPDPKVVWTRVIESARQIHDFLQQLGLESFVKTTGGKGLHLVLPIDRRHEWSDAKAFCKQVADTIVLANPTHYTSNLSKAARSNKIFIDYLRNGRGSTAVVAYSTRAKEDATVSMPLAWDELTPKLTSNHFTIRNAIQRLTSLKRDPWEGFFSKRQSLTDPIEQLQGLAKKTVSNR